VQALERSVTSRHQSNRVLRSDDNELRTNQIATTLAQINGSGPRILIASAAVGTGDLMAAEAIATAMRCQSPDALVCSVDILASATFSFRWSYAQVYLDLI
jgi:hypothetical protein